MKNVFIGILMFLVVALAVGIEPVQRAINQATNRGMLRGVEKCMIYSHSDLLAKEAVRAACVQSFHVRLYEPNLASGQAGPRLDHEKVGWGGTLENKTPDHVTTWIRIAVTIFDAEGVKQEAFAETHIWIAPLDKAEFWVELPDFKSKQFENLAFCDLDEKDPKKCMGWGITDVKGLSI